jgi:hypothetical protein
MRSKSSRNFPLIYIRRLIGVSRCFCAVFQLHKLCKSFRIPSVIDSGARAEEGMLLERAQNNERARSIPRAFK